MYYPTQHSILRRYLAIEAYQQYGGIHYAICLLQADYAHTPPTFVARTILSQFNEPQSNSHWQEMYAQWRNAIIKYDPDVILPFAWPIPVTP